MNVLARFLETTVQIPAPQVDVTTILLHLLALLPLVGGYLLAREGKDNLLFEVIAVLLLVLATVVPLTPETTTINAVLDQFLARWPLMVFLLGLAFVRDGGYKIVVGVVLMAISGLILLPRP
jgi:hypothetical protein